MKLEKNILSGYIKYFFMETKFSRCHWYWQQKANKINNVQQKNVTNHSLLFNSKQSFFLCFDTLRTSCNTSFLLYFHIVSIYNFIVICIIYLFIAIICMTLLDKFQLSHENHSLRNLLLCVHLERTFQPYFYNH